VSAPAISFQEEALDDAIKKEKNKNKKDPEWKTNCLYSQTT
jgi:hypothetical protein